MKTYGITDSPFGKLILAKTEDGLSLLKYVDKSAELKAAHPGPGYSQDDAWATAIVNKWMSGKSLGIKLKPFGTSFQMNVWNTLLKVPLGSTVSYGELAKQCGHPTAVRAVGSAVSRNPISIIIPCHRVLPKDGKLGNYRSGSHRKKLLLEWEGASFRPNPV